MLAGRRVRTGRRLVEDQGRLTTVEYCIAVPADRRVDQGRLTVEYVGRDRSVTG